MLILLGGMGMLVLAFAFIDREYWWLALISGGYLTLLGVLFLLQDARR